MPPRGGGRNVRAAIAQKLPKRCLALTSGGIACYTLPAAGCNLLLKITLSRHQAHPPPPLPRSS